MNKELYFEGQSLYFIDALGQKSLIYNEPPQPISEQELDMLEKDYSFSEWNRESARYENYINITDSDIINLVDDWKVVGTTKYGRAAVSEAYKLRRGLTFNEFYGGTVVD